MAHTVMPFDMSKTIHVFAMNEHGGIQRVETKDGADNEQVKLIREHLLHEYENFRRGDFSDPAALHGASMPGLAELQAHASHIRVSYQPLSNGAALTFFASDLPVITAIHRWFGAQLSEHGSDARAE